MPLRLQLQLMLQLGHISAWISVEGVKLQPHGVAVSADGKNTSCWIASEAGKASPTARECRLVTECLAELCR
jgi:hypothetical protein